MPSSSRCIVETEFLSFNAISVKADPDGIFFEAGDTDKITAKITKTSNKKKSVLWKNHVKSKIRYTSSDESDESVVTVDSKGNVQQ